jgi:2-phosphoglycerate kinase
MKNPEYKFTNPDTILFMSGVPLSGKSTLAPLVASSIEGCTIQPMDIFRLIAQKLEEYKPENERSPFVWVGSCDSYVCIGDGRYTSENLITGFKEYAKKVSSVLDIVIPKLEVRGVTNIIFEGVQLTPENVAPYLTTRNNKLIIVTSSEKKLAENRQKLFGDNPELHEQFSNEKLLLLQSELLRQRQSLTEDSCFVVENTGEYSVAVDKIVQNLLESRIIKPLNT